MPIWPFHRSRADTDAETLLAAVTRASRRPEFFGEGKIPDTLEGRFEMMTINGALALFRLQAEPSARPLAQAFSDQLFRLFDSGLREAGTGDTAVPKRMNKLAAAFFGRLDAYTSALEDGASLEAALARNVWGSRAHPFAPALARYVSQTARAQTGTPISALFGDQGWPAP